MDQHDYGMFAKGYRYKLIPTDGSFAPLYSKTAECGPLLRSYPDKKFDVVKMAKLKEGATIGALYFGAGTLVRIQSHVGTFWEVFAIDEQSRVHHTVLPATDLEM